MSRRGYGITLGLTSRASGLHIAPVPSYRVPGRLQLDMTQPGYGGHVRRYGLRIILWNVSSLIHGKAGTKRGGLFDA